jgi:hypothetical protein
LRRGAALAGLVGGLCACLGGAPAHAAPADSPDFALLNKVCIQTRADRAAALAAGQAVGLALASPNGAADILANMQLEDAEARGKLAGERVMMLIVGRKTTTLAGQTQVENLCAIATAAPSDAADAAFRNWIGTLPASNHGGNPFFVFTGPPTQRQSAAAFSEADAAAAIHQGDMQTAAILHLPDTTVLVYGRFAP